MPLLHALVTEILLTFLVMTVVLATAEAGNSVGKQAALAVGFTVAVCGFVGGRFDLLGIYLAGPCAGATLAALAALLLLDPPTSEERKAAKGS